MLYITQPVTLQSEVIETVERSAELATVEPIVVQSEAISQRVDGNSEQSLFNKTLIEPTITDPTITVGSKSVTIPTPDADEGDTLVNLSSQQELSNKTLTSPSLTFSDTPTITVNDVSQTLLTSATTFTWGDGYKSLTDIIADIKDRLLAANI